ncbi:hypothetical protein BU24DRAFT_170254 [Aaosphaeria arxii CBS 175.79]|uniref:Metallo-beta-lactamase domain-containing protein n=1 Tax=Aaosphaeria arxii CBS 175.79 TaxID=1450172 RepID=A0A6A5Y0S8_9PLEO|nr:uncharacterized protein BU24DRAFT_170254 [Aaosphaeria arxii CBS 175.79]KAF2018400.1 hypothetical protein BU24DRAFT_170254 [Aaosphaeria arxii CBS 175.79]
MSLTVRSLNGDTAFLLTFVPPVAPPLSSPGLFPGSFTILIDPWLTGPSIILNSIFSISEQKNAPCIKSLRDLDHEPDLILISQDKPDHCHQETLCQLPQDCQSTILATPPAARKIKSWKHFQPELVQTLPKYAEGDSRSIYRLVLPPMSPRGSCGEVTVTWLPAKWDVTNLHHAIGITYRPPCSVLSANPGYYLDLPMSPPLSPGSPRTIASSPSTIVPSPNNDREKTISVVYSPHGVPYDIIRPYASSHLVAESALPLSALIHSFDRVENPWWLGGNVSAGSPGGLQIARSLYAQAWISAHDADKDNRGISVKQVRIGKYAVDEVKKMFQLDHNELKPVKLPQTEIISLAPGEEHKIVRG